MQMERRAAVTLYWGRWAKSAVDFDGSTGCSLPFPLPPPVLGLAAALGASAAAGALGAAAGAFGAGALAGLAASPTPFLPPSASCMKTIHVSEPSLAINANKNLQRD